MNDVTSEHSAFMAGVRMIASEIRMPQLQRWDDKHAKMRFLSLVQSYPEITDRQFYWACSQYVQTIHSTDQRNFPAWTELMHFLYERHPTSGFPDRNKPRMNLPPQIQFLPKQHQLIQQRQQQELAAVRKALPPTFVLRPGRQALMTTTKEWGGKKWSDLKERVLAQINQSQRDGTLTDPL